MTPSVAALLAAYNKDGSAWFTAFPPGDVDLVGRCWFTPGVHTSPYACFQALSGTFRDFQGLSALETNI